ncbi:DNA starvation/stationary phase protection protein [Candidatus Roizmanbacteria bacterium]|nr:MAG: DNA starvation/stationary phase protection protein [Candidatus Roizmanbacteria bacterium]
MATTELAQPLKNLLADSYILMLKTQNYHWNVTGIHFHALHEMFQTQYEDLFTAVDEIAERLRAIGVKSPGTFDEFRSLSEIDSEDVKKESKEMLVSLKNDHMKLTKTAKKLIEVAQEAKDDPTMDLAIGRLQTHEKHIWMLSSSLE